MTLVLTTDFRRTLKLYWPRPIFLLFSVLLPFALIPVANEVLQNLEWFFPKPPSSAFDIIKAMGSSEVPVMLALAGRRGLPGGLRGGRVPGFILTGWQRSYRGWAAITMSSVAFGMIHMIPHQVFNAVFLGFVLGLLAVRAGPAARGSSSTSCSMRRSCCGCGSGRSGSTRGSRTGCSRRRSMMASRCWIST